MIYRGVCRYRILVYFPYISRICLVLFSYVSRILSCFSRVFLVYFRASWHLYLKRISKFSKNWKIVKNIVFCKETAYFDAGFVIYAKFRSWGWSQKWFSIDFRFFMFYEKNTRIWRDNTRKLRDNYENNTRNIRQHSDFHAYRYRGVARVWYIR